MIHLINSAPHSLSSMTMLARTSVCSSSLVTKTILTFFLLKPNNANLVEQFADLDSTMKQSPQNGSSVRDLSDFGFVETVFTEIMAYGCWCFLDPANDYRQNARGRPVDDIDRTCRSLINGYKCATMDAEANGEEECDAQTVDYVKFNLLSGDIENLEADCISLNPDSVCAQRACQIEMVFVYPLLQSSGPQNLDENLVHVSAGGTERGK